MNLSSNLIPGAISSTTPKSRSNFLICLARALSIFMALALVQMAVPGNSALSKSNKEKLLLLPIQVKSAQDMEGVEGQLTFLLGEALREKGFAALDQDKVQELLTRQNIQTLNLEKVSKLTRSAGADYGFYGVATGNGPKLHIDLRMVGAAENKIIQSFETTHEKDTQLSKSVEKLSEEINTYLSSREIITDIQVSGNEIVDESYVLSRLNLQKGEEFDKEKIDSEIKRLYKSGYFDNVKVFLEDTNRGKKITFQVEEKPLIKEIVVKGNKNLADNKILDKMQTETGSVLNTETLGQDLKKIKKLYRKEGHYRAKVSYEQKDVAQGQAKLIIRIEEGKQLYIRNIEIKGAEKIPPGDLRDKLSLSERWIFSWMTGGGILKEKNLNRDVAVLKSYYAQKGFIDVQIAQPDVEFTREGINITFRIVEGPRYRVKDISLQGDIISPVPKLKQMIQMDDLAAKNRFFDRSVMNQDRQRLTNYYTNYGYAYANTNIDLDKNREDKTVSITYSINKKQKIYIRRLEIGGNKKTRDNVIRREMLLTDGSQFNGNKLSSSKRNLNRLGYFKSVDIDTIPTGEPNKMDLKVNVQEKSTGSFSAGAGYSSIDQAFFTAKLQERNFLGKGYTTSLQGKYSSESTRFQLSFWNPHLYDGPLGVGFDAYNTYRIYDDYDLLNTGGRMKFGYTIGDFTRFYWNFQVSRYEVSDIDDFANENIKALEGQRWSRTVSISAKRDTTDKHYAPTEGTKNNISLEYTGGVLGGDDNFIKAEYDFSYYFTPLWKFTFNWHWNAGKLFENSGEQVPDFERFYLGGLNSVRGYDYRDISSSEYNESYGAYTDVGGYKFFQNNFEMYFPLKEDMGILAVFFFDGGNVWDKSEDLSMDLYRSYGAGIRWNSPMGPLRLEYAFPIDDLKNNGPGFEFSIGGFF